jgi:hypothetical protein
MKIKRYIIKTFILSGLVMVFSCNQDPIFFKISQETIPVKPHVPGSPTNMVEFDRNGDGNLVMYVASGKRLYWYKDGAWDSGSYSTPQPNGWIMCLAVTKDYLYALCNTDLEIVLRRIRKSSGNWDSISISDTQYTVLQTIYADPATDRLFAGARLSDPTVYKYGILSVADGDSSLKEFIGDTQLLSGAASNDPLNTCYLSTTGKGVYKVNISGTTPSVDTFSGGNNFFVGMIKLNDDDETIIMVERNGGAFYKVDDDNSTIVSIGVSTGKYAMGGLALWTDGSTHLLIAGIQGDLNTSGTSSLFTHGYVEIKLTDGLPNGSPNDPPTITVASSEQYQASLGKHPIKYMHQAPDGRFFASTQSTGLWSYKERSDGWQWNAEN